MKGENIFRFCGVRPSAPEKTSGKTKLVFDPYSVIAQKTEIYDKVKKGNFEEIKSSARAFQRSSAFSETIAGFKSDKSGLMVWFNESKRLPAKTALNSDAFFSLCGKPDSFISLYSTLTDSIFSIAILGNSSKRKSDELLLVLKLLFIYQGEISPSELEENLGVYISRLTAAFPHFQKPIVKNTVAPQRKPAAEKKQNTSSLSELENAHREVLRLISSAQPTLVKTKVGTEKQTKRSSAKPEESIGSRISSNIFGELRLPASIISSVTKSVLNKIKADIKQISPFEILRMIEQEMDMATTAEAQQRGKTMLRVGNFYIDTAALYGSIGNENMASEADCTFAAGIGDLLLIRQKLKGYRLAEIAHVENVLKGEKRDRNHRRLNRITEDFFTASETEKTKERDLETTERNELQSQISNTATTELGLNLGVQVSGSYGPTVSFDSQLDSSFSTTVQETQQKAVDFSRSISEKASEKIRELTKRERRSTSLEEVEEINSHKFENSTEKNITGVYRWLDKIYDTQVMNYGQRMIFDFVLPEPAAFYLFSLAQSPPEGSVIVKPEAPLYNQQPLAPSNISRTNYHQYIKQYNVTGVPQPPPQIITVSHFDQQDGSAKDDYSRSSKIQLPEHYEAYAASVANDCSMASTGSPHARIYIGDGVFTTVGGWQYAGFARRREKEIAVAVHYHNVFNFSLGIDIYCEITKEGFASWQQKVYDAILEVYQNQLAEYEEKLATASIQRNNSSMIGTDALTNATIIQEELRKLSVQLLTNHAAPGLDSLQAGEPPLIDVNKTCENGSIIRFFENAFEWNNMAYVMYPYFWGKKARWADAIQITASDNLFTTFIKAGATRVQLSVRPGFERAVVYFIQYGTIWEGNDPPLLNDDAYLPIVQEITENLGTLEDGIPYPEGSEPWEVSLPTSLVYLQENHPEFKDSLEG